MPFAATWTQRYPTSEVNQTDKDTHITALWDLKETQMNLSVELKQTQSRRVAAMGVGWSGILGAADANHYLENG